MLTETPETKLFAEATLFVQQNLLIDAISKYIELSSQFPESELADDALFNAGLCYFHINLFTDAITTFNMVLANYPNGDINTSNDKEHGKIAAKCHYALINCHLGTGNITLAQNELNNLKIYTDSYILTDIGQKMSFSELGEKALKSYSTQTN